MRVQHAEGRHRAAGDEEDPGHKEGVGYRAAGRDPIASAQGCRSAFPAELRHEIWRLRPPSKLSAETLTLARFGAVGPVTRNERTCSFYFDRSICEIIDMLHNELAAAGGARSLDGQKIDFRGKTECGSLPGGRLPPLLP